MNQKVQEHQKLLGLTPQKYKNKYIFQLKEDPDAFYYHRFTPSPSQLTGILPQQQQKIKSLGCLMIVQAGIFLRLPITTTVSAQTIFHYFFQRVSLLQYDYRDAAMGSLFLAAQYEQTIRKSAHIALVFDQVFKIHQKSRRPARIADIESKQFKAIQSKIIEMEKVILIELGFQVHRILETPHRYMNSIFQIFTKHPQLEKIVHLSWGYLNDCYRTNICLFYPGQIIAVSCIFLALRTLDLGVGQLPWWCLFQSNLQIMEDICVDILSVYESRTDYYAVEKILSRLSEKNNCQNVFAVPYYRKIMNQIELTEIQKQRQKQQQKHRGASRQRSRQNRRKDTQEGNKCERQRKRDEQNQGLFPDKSEGKNKQFEKTTVNKFSKEEKYSNGSGQQTERKQRVNNIKDKLKQMIDKKEEKPNRNEGIEVKSNVVAQQDLKNGDIEQNNNMISFQNSMLLALRLKFLKNNQNTESKQAIQAKEKDEKLTQNDCE